MQLKDIVTIDRARQVEPKWLTILICSHKAQISEHLLLML